MEATLINYMGLDGDSCVEVAVRIAGACRRHRGEFALLWHNWPLLGTRGQKKLYRKVIDAIAPGAS